MGVRGSGWRGLSLRATVVALACLLVAAGTAPASAATPETPVVTPTPTPTATVTPTPSATPISPKSTPVPEVEPTPTPAEPTPQPRDAPEVDASQAVPVSVPSPGRIGGNDMFDRSALASRAAFAQGADVVVVASGESTVAPVIAASMVAARTAPLLLVRKTSVPSAVASELRRLTPQRIVFVGTASDVSSGVLSALGQVAPVERTEITSRWHGSQQALVSGPSVSTVYLTGSDLAELAAATATAAATRRGVLMVNSGSSVPAADAIAALREVGASSLILVGSSITTAYATALTNAGFTVSRRSGADAYALSSTLAKDVGGSVSRAFTANPDVIQDAALASALAAVTRQMLLFSPRPCVLTTSAQYITSRGARVVAVGKLNWLLTPVVHNTPCSTEKPRREAALSAAIVRAMSGHPGTYSVSVRELGKVGERIGIRATERLEPASMMKLYAAWAALTRVERGQASLDQWLPSAGVSLRDCIHVMIHVSDNKCHTDIVHWIGIGTLNGMLADLGLSNTAYGSVPPGADILYAGNRTTTTALTSFMMRLERGELLNSTHTALLLGEMRGQIFRSRLASGIPPGIVQESKPGSLWIASGLLQADTGIVHGRYTAFTVSVIGVDGATKAGISAITRAAYSVLNESFGSAASYPVQQMATTASVHMRSTAGGAVTATIPRGAFVEVTDSDRLWYRVRWSGRLGWVDSHYLRNR